MMLSRVCRATQAGRGAACPSWHTALPALPRRAAPAARRHCQEPVLAARGIHPYKEQESQTAQQELVLLSHQ